MDVSDDVIISATRLRAANLQQKEIKNYALDILKQLNTEITQASFARKTSIITEMPILFDITNMSQKDAQIAVWSTIVFILKSKSYRVQIKFTNHVCRLKITWISVEEEKMRKTQLDLLAMHTAEF